MAAIGNNVTDGSCITGYKSQGSEYNTVVIFIPEHKQWLDYIVHRKLLYTMCTRAKKRVYIVYKPQIVYSGACDKHMMALGSFSNMAVTESKTPDVFLKFKL